MEFQKFRFKNKVDESDLNEILGNQLTKMKKFKYLVSIVEENKGILKNVVSNNWMWLDE